MKKNHHDDGGPERLYWRSARTNSILENVILDMISPVCDKNGAPAVKNVSLKVPRE